MPDDVMAWKRLMYYSHIFRGNSLVNGGLPYKLPVIMISLLLAYTHCRCVRDLRRHGDQTKSLHSWWRHQMEIFSALLALCVGSSPVTGEFPSQMPVTRSFDVLFDLRLNKRLSKQSWGWWFEMPSRPLWRHSNVESVRPFCSSLKVLIWKPAPRAGENPTPNCRCRSLTVAVEPVLIKSVPKL